MPLCMLSTYIIVIFISAIAVSGAWLTLCYCVVTSKVRQTRHFIVSKVTFTFRVV